MKCFFCSREACAKVGSSKASLWKALFGGNALKKIEIYSCRKHIFEAQYWEGNLKRLREIDENHICRRVGKMKCVWGDECPKRWR
jgi:hypothetical protein